MKRFEFFDGLDAELVNKVLSDYDTWTVEQMGTEKGKFWMLLTRVTD
jgi:hypothetical protein